MKQALVLIAVGASLFSFAAAFAASNSNMETSGRGSQQRSSTIASMSHGEVRKVDTAAGKLIIKHGPLENLAMDWDDDGVQGQ